jgi:hypothetical protein
MLTVELQFVYLCIRVEAKTNYFHLKQIHKKFISYKLNKQKIKDDVGQQFIMCIKNA